MLYHYPEKEYSTNCGIIPDLTLANELAEPYESYGRSRYFSNLLSPTY